MGVALGKLLLKLLFGCTVGEIVKGTDVGKLEVLFMFGKMVGILELILVGDED